MIIGGAINTNETNDQKVADNLINDLSIEYYLNDTGNKYLRLFHHRGVESVLEGQITKTGIGFVMKRKLSSLRELFHKAPKKAIILPSVQELDQNDSIDTPNDSILGIPLKKEDDDSIPIDNNAVQEGSPKSISNRNLKQ